MLAAERNWLVLLALRYGLVWEDGNARRKSLIV